MLESRKLLAPGDFRSFVAVVSVVVALLLAATLLAQPIESTGGKEVVHLRVDSIIHPVAAQYIIDGLREADSSGATAVVIELDTPGGLLESTRDIFEAMLASDAAVVVYVSPSGAQAASAGFFLLMAADIAVMAPGTNTGAAHPVLGGGAEAEGVMAEKMEQDSAATIRSLATRNGRNVELAEAAVVESRSFTAEEALESDLIDFMAPSVTELVAALDGWELALEGEAARSLETADATVRSIELSGFQRILSAIAHPNIAFLLLSIGGLGIYFELSNPGAIVPGVIGVISLILAFFALSVLPFSYAGIALIVLAMILFILELKVTSYGLLTIAGLTSLVLGSLMLFKSADPAVRVSIEIIVMVTAFAAVLVTFLVSMVVRAHRRQVRTGREGLIHETGVARSELAPDGKVFVHGELWDAVTEGSIPAGARVEVVGVEGMRLRVQPHTG